MKTNGTTKGQSLSRRQFVQHSGMLAAAGSFLGMPAIVPATVLGKNAPSNRINIGMIGTGRWARATNTPQFLREEDCRIVAVCDVDAWRLEESRKQVNEYYAQRYNSSNAADCRAYLDYRALLSQPDIDAVMISSPDHWHVPHAIDAVKAGKDVCCEKPLTLSIEKGRVLANLAKKYNCVFRTDSEARSDRYFHRMCELVVNGRIGNLKTIRAGVPSTDQGSGPVPEMPVPAELDYERWIGPAPMAPYTEKRVHPSKSWDRPGWMRVRDYCEGLVTNWGTHIVDVVQWANGTDRTGPILVEAKGTYPKEKGLWNVMLTFEAYYKYANGVELFYSNIENRPFVRCEGDEGWLEYTWFSEELKASSESILKSEIEPNETRLLLKGDKRDFLDCVKTRERTLQDAEVGHRTCSLCQLANISVEAGEKRLNWDPDKEVFDAEDANRLKSRNVWRAEWLLNR